MGKAAQLAGLLVGLVGSALLAQSNSSAGTTIFASPLDGADPPAFKQILTSGPASFDTGIVNLPNGTTRAASFGDDTSAITRVAATSNLSATPFTGQVRGTTATADVSSSALFIGQPGAPANVPVAIRVVYRFEGFFTDQSNTQEQLFGSMLVGARSTETTNYSSQLTFTRNPFLNNNDVTVFTKGTKMVTDANGNSTFSDDSNALPSATSTSAEAVKGALSGELQVDLSLLPGTRLSVSAGIGAGVILVTETDTGYEAGLGGVNAIDTGTMTVYMPKGYTLSVADGTFLSNPNVVVASVPEPSHALMIFTALGLVVFATRRQLFAERDTASIR